MAHKHKDIEELAWVIEADGSYWNGKSVGHSAFVTNSLEAVRFARHEDAERVKYWLLREHAFALRSTHHIWISTNSARG